jgi:hypothetical protein
MQSGMRTGRLDQPVIEENDSSTGLPLDDPMRAIQK